MDWFDAFEEVFASVDAYVRDHGHAPHEIVVSPTLYTWLADLLREESVLHGSDFVSDPLMLTTPHGSIRIVIDEMMNPFEVHPQ